MQSVCHLLAQGYQVVLVVNLVATHKGVDGCKSVFHIIEPRGVVGHILGHGLVG